MKRGLRQEGGPVPIEVRAKAEGPEHSGYNQLNYTAWILWALFWLGGVGVWVSWAPTHWRVGVGT